MTDLASPGGAPPLLTARGARVAVDDVIAIPDLTVTTRGDRVLFVGDVTVLFAALSGVPLIAASTEAPPGELTLAGEARVASGELRLLGHDVATQAHLAVAGFAPLDPPVPKTMTALAYVEWAARLAGIRPRAANEMAAGALHKMGMLRSANRMCATLAPAERRALQLAKAIAHDPQALVAEAPLDRLEGDAASFVMNALAVATEGRKALLSARRVDPGTLEGTIARSATQLVFLGEGGVVAEGAPSSFTGDARVYRLTVATNAEALREALATRGLRLDDGTGRAGGVHFTVALPEGTTTAPLIEAASEARSAVVEMVPLIG